MPQRGRAAPAFVLLAAVSVILPPVIPGDTILMDLNARTEFLYDELRRSPFTLDVLEDAIAEPALGLELEMRDSEGDRYLCTMPGPGDAAAGADGSGDGSSRADSEEKLLAQSPARLLRSLEGRCDVLSLGWWSYEWCHRKGVRQFHVDHAVGKIDPAWSLGEYAHSVDPPAAREAAAEHLGADGGDRGHSASASPPPAVDVFLNGQHCDEVGAGRSTQVEFRCCGDAAAADAAKAATQGGGGGGDAALGAPAKKAKRASRRPPVATLASIVEPATCTYEAVVCTPLLCDRGGASSGSGPGRNASALELLEPLRGVCLARHEGWWGYELCVGQQARQFHLEASSDAKGHATTRVAAEFVLGKASKEPSAERIVPPSPSVEDFANAPSTLEFEYEGGTSCDLLPAHTRSATVAFRCGPHNALVSVVEDRTCHYAVSATTPHLCAHPAFVHRRPPTRPVTCRRQDGGGGGGGDSGGGDSGGEL